VRVLLVTQVIEVEDNGIALAAVDAGVALEEREQIAARANRTALA
jgi:hypothetical protein